MAKRKTMTKAQKAMNAKIKKELQEKGIVPPDKPRLNRKKYIEEAREEWNGRDAEYYAWDVFLYQAISIVLGHTDRHLSRSGGSGEDPEACTQAQGVPRQVESGRQGHLYNG